MSPRFGWVGATRRRHLVEAVRACVDAWLHEWSVAPDVSAVQLEESVVVPLSADKAHVIRIGPEEARWMLAIGTDDQQVLGNWLAGVETVDGEELAGQVAIEALRDLVIQLAARGGHGGAPEDHGQGPWPAGAVRDELGAVGIRATIGAASLVLACERAVVDTISPQLASVASQPPLVERKASIGNATVQIAAVLDFGSMSAPELFDLQVGEVLIGECALDTRTRLIAPGSVLLAEAAMCKTGDRRAVVLLKTSTTQESQ